MKKEDLRPWVLIPISTGHQKVLVSTLFNAIDASAWAPRIVSLEQHLTVRADRGSTVANMNRAAAIEFGYKARGVVLPTFTLTQGMAAFVRYFQDVDWFLLHGFQGQGLRRTAKLPQRPNDWPQWFKQRAR